MHRLLVATSELEKDAPALSREAQNHLRVLRPKDGESLELFDGKGRWRVFRCVRRAGASCLVPSASVQCEARSEGHALTLFACVTKGSRWDWTLEKATELGVSRIVPVISERTIVRISADECAAKRERWQRIVEEAARQSDAKWLPEICDPVDFTDSLALVRACDCLVGALTTPPPKPIGEVLFAKRKAADMKPLAVYVGPEGDFTPEELATLLAVATPVSFGSTILRAETAAIYGVSVVKAWLDGLGFEV